MTGPILETARLRLRPFPRDDVDMLVTHWRKEDVRRWLWDGRVVEREEVVDVVEESIGSFAAGRAGFWVIERRAGASPDSPASAMPARPTSSSTTVSTRRIGRGSRQAARAAAMGVDTLGLRRFPSAPTARTRRRSR
jgi:hypothetical protein